MKKIIFAFTMFLGVSAGAQPYSSTYLSSTTGLASQYFTGIFYLAAGSATYLTPTITLDGTGGGVTATSATFTAAGPTTFSLTTSSGISTGGPIVLPDGTVIYSTTQFSGSGGNFSGGTVPNAAYFSSDVYVGGANGLIVASSVTASTFNAGGVPKAVEIVVAFG